VSITVTLFLVLLSAISDISLSSPQFDSYLSTTPSAPLTPHIFSCLASGASSPCLVLSYLSLLSLPRSGSFASSAPLDDASFSASHQFHLSAFHPLRSCLFHISSLPSLDCFFQAWKYTPHSSPRHMHSLLHPELHTSRNVPFSHYPQHTHVIHRRLWPQRRVITHIPCYLLDILPSPRYTFRSIDGLYFCSLTQLRTHCVHQRPTQLSAYAMVTELFMAIGSGIERITHDGSGSDETECYTSKRVTGWQM